MKARIFSLKRLIRELAADLPLQKYAFADQRKDTPEEPNTEDEQELFYSLQDYFKNNSTIDNHMAKMIKDALTCGQYKDVFRAPDERTVYRGMGVDDAFLKRALKLTDDKEIPDIGDKSASFTFEPYHGTVVTSWTTDANIAINFAGDHADRRHPWQLIMIAAVSDNPNQLVVGPDGLYKIAEFSDYSLEDEVLALGAVKVSQVAWSRMGTDMQLPVSDTDW